MIVHAQGNRKIAMIDCCEIGADVLFSKSESILFDQENYPILEGMHAKTQSGSKNREP